jgi:serine/threonine-protein kinase
VRAIIGLVTQPSRIGRYQVISLLGQGAMGVVYRGRDETLDRDVALKLMALGPGAAPDARARFLREARSAARLAHPNIVTIYEAGEHQGVPFIAMELLEGVDLHSAIEGGLRPDPKITLPIVLQVLSGLSHAHEHGIVHRDVKPSNVFLPRKRPAKLLDFGLARLTENTEGTSGLMVGTPNYMSPEQVGGASLDGRSDLFSTGLILYELVTGEKAYVGDSVITVLFKIAHEEPDLSLLPREPAWARLREVLECSLARQPGDRFPDAAAMSAALEAALFDLGGGRDWMASSVRGVFRSGARPAPESVDPTPEPVELAPPPPPPLALPEPPRRAQPIQRWQLVAAGLAVSGLALAVAAALFALLGPLGPGGVGPSPPPSMAPSEGPAGSLPATAAPGRSPAGSLPTPPPPSSTQLPVSTTLAAATPPPPPPPAEAAGNLDRANEHMAKGRYAAALAEAKAVQRREPGNEEARAIAEDAEVQLVVEDRLRKARDLVKRGDREAALSEVRAALTVAPSDARLIALFRELTQ